MLTMTSAPAARCTTAGPVEYQMSCGFPEPLFSGGFEIVEQRTVGENHLKMRVRPGTEQGIIDAIAFNQAGLAYRGEVQLVCRLDVNEYRGIEAPQLIVEQIMSHGHRA